MLDERDFEKIRFALQIAVNALDKGTLKKYQIQRRLGVLNSVDFHKPTLDDLIVYRTTIVFILREIIEEPDCVMKRSSLRILKKLNLKLKKAIEIVVTNENSRNSEKKT